MGLGTEAVVVQYVSTAIKCLIMTVMCVQIPPLMVWAERRGPAFMQRRKGPNRVGLFKWRLWGLLQSAADAVKLIFKEEIVPDKANKIFFHVAPLFSLFPVLLIAAVIPYGNDIVVMGYTIPLHILKIDVGFLFILALASLAVYGVTLSGWACNNKYSLLGSMRASAQMISYEIPMGLSLIPIVLIFDTLDLGSIVRQQSSFLEWGIFKAPISFFLFLICMFAETNRAPFDLAEGESELVAGFHTEYGSAKFALFFLAEYVGMFILGLLAATMFFGGWQAPFISYETLQSLLGTNLASLVGFLTLLLKGAFFMWLYIWVRWTLPRFRYDTLMSLGWKFMLPLGLANVLVTAVVIAILEF